MGPDLMETFRAQAERFGADIRYEDVTGLDLDVRPFRVTTDEGDFFAHSVIIATAPRLAGLVWNPRRDSADAAFRRAPPVTGHSSATRKSPWWAAATAPWRKQPSSPASRPRLRLSIGASN